MIRAREVAVQAITWKNRLGQIVRENPDREDLAAAHDQAEAIIEEIKRVVARIETEVHLMTLERFYEPLSEEQIAEALEASNEFGAASNWAKGKFDSDFTERMWREMMDWPGEKREAEKHRAWAKIFEPLKAQYLARLDEIGLVKRGPVEDPPVDEKEELRKRVRGNLRKTVPEPEHPYVEEVKAQVERMWVVLRSVGIRC
jgi:hypothetical protein